MNSDVTPAADRGEPAGWSYLVCHLGLTPDDPGGWVRRGDLDSSASPTEAEWQEWAEALDRRRVRVVVRETDWSPVAKAEGRELDLSRMWAVGRDRDIVLVVLARQMPEAERVRVLTERLTVKERAILGQSAA